MAVIKFAKWIPLNFTECVLYCARNCGDYKEIKELDFSGDTDTCRKFTVKQSFKSTIQVMSQNWNWYQMLISHCLRAQLTVTILHWISIYLAMWLFKSLETSLILQVCISKQNKRTKMGIGLETPTSPKISVNLWWLSRSYMGTSIYNHPFFLPR